MDWLAGGYLWIKALHILAVISWMAGLLYLPRLFVYHTETAAGSPESERFKVMERRLLRGIMNPAMIAAFLFGGLLLSIPGVADWSSGWLWLKLFGVTVLAVLHHAMGRWRKAFAADANVHSQRYYRIANEAPALAMVLIVVMVVVKPL